MVPKVLPEIKTLKAKLERGAQTLKDSAFQLLIKYKSGALVTQLSY